MPWVPKTVARILYPSSGSHAQGIHICWPSSRFFFLLLSKLKTLKLIFTEDLQFITAQISFCFIKVDEGETPLRVDMIPSA